jgi:hypothetical protein
MIRAISWMLAFWLGGLFIVGQGGSVPQWMVWLTGLAAAFAVLGGIIAPSVSEPARIAGPIALSLGLLGLWVAGLALRTEAWLPWCNFLGGIAYFTGAVSAATFPEKRAIPRGATPAHHVHT